MRDGTAGAGEITGEVCIANIGARGERRRRRTGIAWLALGIAGAVVLAVLHAGPALQLTLFAPFALAALGWFEAREHTWIVLASRGRRERSTPPGWSLDDEIQRQVRRQARRVVLRSAFWAALLTAAAAAVAALRG